MDEQSFLDMVTDALCAEFPLTLDEPFPDEIFDSTGKLLLVTALSQALNVNVSMESILHCKTPRDVLDVVAK